MIYCNLKQKKNTSAIYYFGASLNDMSGEVEFFSENKNPSIIKQPETKFVVGSLITKLFVKYKTDFSKGVYPKKISYECKTGDGSVSYASCQKMTLNNRSLSLEKHGEPRKIGSAVFFVDLFFS